MAKFKNKVELNWLTSDNTVKETVYTGMYFNAELAANRGINKIPR